MKTIGHKERDWQEASAAFLKFANIHAKIEIANPDAAVGVQLGFNFFTPEQNLKPEERGLYRIWCSYYNQNYPWRVALLKDNRFDYHSSHKSLADAIEWLSKLD